MVALTDDRLRESFISIDCDVKHGHVRLIRDHLGYWHWKATATSGQVIRSRPPATAVWFGHWSRRGALRAARKSLRLVMEGR